MCSYVHFLDIIMRMQKQEQLSGIEVSVSVLAQMFSYLTSQDADVEEFLRSLDLDPDEIGSPDTYLPLETYLLIEEAAAEYVEDPYFGLHMGEHVEAGSWSILGYMMMNCSTLGEAFEKSTRYQRIIGNLIEGKASIGWGKIKVKLVTPPHTPDMPRHCFESALASTVTMMRTLTGKQLNPQEVTFNYPEPESKSEYERVFQCPVLFDQTDTSMSIDIGIINTPITHANPDLLGYFEQYAQEFLTEMERQSEYTQAVTRILLNHMDDESMTIRKVAKELAMSVRTLQKRLKEEGVVFSELQQEVREKLAKKYLREDYTVENITYLLGYSEPSTFRKAFKKWSGHTPKEYREHAYTG
jgi:AraC-like DNA-binding protein